MKKQPSTPEVDGSKVLSIWALYFVAGLVILSGTCFSVISIMNDVRLTVLTSQIPGYLFGVVVIVLGLRSLIAVRKLKNEVYKPASRFSWSNFKQSKR